MRATAAWREGGSGVRVLLTGATGGLGPALTRALADAGAALAISGLPGSGLSAVAEGLAGGRSPRGDPRGPDKAGLPIVPLPADLRAPGAAARLVQDAVAALGGVDVLVHGAGVEHVGRFETQTPESLEEIVGVNLLAAMHLSRALVPGMLARGSGRLIFVGSLSGKVGPPYTGAYAASKAGLIALSRTLRAEYRGRGVSASVVVPGFVRGAGMYHRARREAGFGRVWALRTVGVESVVRAVLRALDRDAPEVLVQPGPTRLMLALGELLPGLVGQRLGAWSGADRLFREWADARLETSRPHDVGGGAPFEGGDR